MLAQAQNRRPRSVEQPSRPIPAAGQHESIEVWYRSTFGLRRIEGSWRIAHRHDSTPFYMDGSFRAATDLKP